MNGNKKETYDDVEPSHSNASEENQENEDEHGEQQDPREQSQAAESSASKKHRADDKDRNNLVSISSLH